MKSKILLLALTVALLSSCSTSYKTGQTPDDVYFSPVRPQEESVQSEERNDNRDYQTKNDDYYDDQYLRMKIRNRYRWSELDDPFYYSRRYNYSVYNCCCASNPWTPTSYWNNHYNPYYQSYIILNPKALTYTAPRTFNLNAYNNNALTNSNYTTPKTKVPGSTSNYNNSNNNTYTAPRNRDRDNGSNSGNILREVFKSNSSSNNNSSNSSNNNNNSSSSSSSSSSGSSSSSTPAPVRRF